MLRRFMNQRAHHSHRSCTTIDRGLRLERDLFLLSAGEKAPRAYTVGII